MSLSVSFSEHDVQPVQLLLGVPSGPTASDEIGNLRKDEATNGGHRCSLLSSGDQRATSAETQSERHFRGFAFRQSESFWRSLR